MNFSKFNNMVNLDGIKKDIEEAKMNTGSGDFEEVPFGKYEVKLDKLDLVECKSEKNKGQPMISAWFRILTGEQKNRLIFMSQLVNEGFKIHIMNEFLRDLDSGCTIEFVDYEQYGNLLMDIFEASSNTGFVLDYYQNNKGYKSYSIEEVFDM